MCPPMPVDLPSVSFDSAQVFLTQHLPQTLSASTAATVVSQWAVAVSASDLSVEQKRHLLTRLCAHCASHPHVLSKVLKALPPAHVDWFGRASSQSLFQILVGHMVDEDMVDSCAPGSVLSIVRRHTHRQSPYFVHTVPYAEIRAAVFWQLGEALASHPKGLEYIQKIKTTPGPLRQWFTDLIEDLRPTALVDGTPLLEKIVLEPFATPAIAHELLLAWRPKSFTEQAFFSWKGVANSVLPDEQLAAGLAMWVTQRSLPTDEMAQCLIQRDNPAVFAQALCVALPPGLSASVRVAFGNAWAEVPFLPNARSRWFEHSPSMFQWLGVEKLPAKLANSASFSPFALNDHTLNRLCRVYRRLANEGVAPDGTDDWMRFLALCKDAGMLTVLGVVNMAHPLVDATQRLSHPLLSELVPVLALGNGGCHPSSVSLTHPNDAVTSMLTQWAFFNAMEMGWKETATLLANHPQIFVTPVSSRTYQDALRRRVEKMVWDEKHIEEAKAFVDVCARTSAVPFKEVDIRSLCVRWYLKVTYPNSRTKVADGLRELDPLHPSALRTLLSFLPPHLSRADGRELAPLYEKHSLMEATSSAPSFSSPSSKRKL